MFTVPQPGPLRTPRGSTGPLLDFRGIYWAPFGLKGWSTGPLMDSKVIIWTPCGLQGDQRNPLWTPGGSTEPLVDSREINGTPCVEEWMLQSYPCIRPWFLCWIIVVEKNVSVFLVTSWDEVELKMDFPSSVVFSNFSETSEKFFSNLELSSVWFSTLSWIEVLSCWTWLFNPRLVSVAACLNFRNSFSSRPYLAGNQLI